MTPDHLEVIRGLYEAMSRRDLPALQEFSEANPDFEWQSAPDEPDPAVRRGRERNIAYSRLWTKKDGRIASLREFATIDEALECAPRS